jgi:hypothetical protein
VGRLLAGGQLPVVVDVGVMFTHILLETLKTSLTLSQRAMIV